MLRSQRREIARTDEFGQLGMCSQSAASLFVAAIANRGGQTSRRNFPEQRFSVLPRTRVLHFSSQENFFVVIENKIHFFLVAFATDF
jgi:hypothetical protein